MSQVQSKDRQVRRVILIEGAANLLVLLSKLGVGLSTGSMAILADAIHSLADLTNNIIAWIVMHFASKPADLKHPYGHRKLETLAVFVLASILVVLAFEIAINAVRSTQQEVVSSSLELSIMLGVLLVNIGVTKWQHKWANRLNSDILRADVSHTFADVLVTSAAIVGWQLSAMGYIWADKLCALGVAVIVMFLAYDLFRRAIPVLIDEYAIDPQALSEEIKAVEGVCNVYKIRSRWIGQKCLVDLVISVSPVLNIEQSHEIADRVEQLIETKFAVSDVSIHVEPDTNK